MLRIKSSFQLQFLGNQSSQQRANFGVIQKGTCSTFSCGAVQYRKTLSNTLKPGPSLNIYIAPLTIIKQHINHTRLKLGNIH